MLFVSSPVRGTMLVGLSGLLFGLIGYLGTQLFRLQFTVETMLFWRFLIATLTILIVSPTCRRVLFSKQIKPYTILKTLLFATVSYSGGSVFYFLATKHIGTGIAMVVFYSFPVFVFLITWSLNNWRVNQFTLGSLIAVIIGLIFLKSEAQHELNTRGLIYGLIAALSYAIYVFGSQRSAKTIDTLLLTFLVCMGNTIIFFILSLYTHSFMIPQSLNAWMYLFAIGIIATVLPIQFLLMGLKHISSMKASILSVTEPIVTVVIGMLLLDETLSLTQSIGIVIILLGAILIQFERGTRGEAI